MGLANGPWPSESPAQIQRCGEECTETALRVPARSGRRWPVPNPGATLEMTLNGSKIFFCVRGFKPIPVSANPMTTVRHFVQAHTQRAAIGPWRAKRSAFKFQNTCLNLSPSSNARGSSTAKIADDVDLPPLCWGWFCSRQ